MSFNLDDYEYDGGSETMDKIHSMISNNSTLVFGLLVVLGVFAIYSIYKMYTAVPEKFNPTVMGQFIMRDGIGESALEPFDPSKDCSGVTDPLANGLWSALNATAHSPDSFSSRAPSPISDSQFAKNSGGYIPA